MNFHSCIPGRWTAGTFWLVLCVANASAQYPALSAATGPQQMVPYGAQTSYPSTNYPAAYPATSSPEYGLTAQTAYTEQPPLSTKPATENVGIPSTPATPGEYGLSGDSYLGGDVSGNSQPLVSSGYVERSLLGAEPWTWQVLPTGLMYKSYLAGNKEPRLGAQWVHERTRGWFWDSTLGGRVGLIRYGTQNDLWPQGWQLDVEGAAFPRLNLEHSRDLDCADFRAGILLTTRQDAWEFKIGYYHLSSHLGDEFMVRNPGYPRINYVRESTVAGLAFYLNPDLRLYSEAGWAFYTDGGAKPWEFQFGIDYSPADPTGFRGAPFFAINGHLREENDFGGNMTVQTGWSWRGRNGQLTRLGMQYFNGMSDQYQFYREFEEQIGLGLWYDY